MDTPNLCSSSADAFLSPLPLLLSTGKRNDNIENAQPCVVCKGEKVVMCTICQGTGEDQYASLVAGVKEAVGEESTGQKILVEVRGA